MRGKACLGTRKARFYPQEIAFSSEWNGFFLRKKPNFPPKAIKTTSKSMEWHMKNSLQTRAFMLAYVDFHTV